MDTHCYENIVKGSGWASSTLLLGCLSNLVICLWA